MLADQIQYSEKYFDAVYEYRFVLLVKRKLLIKDKK